MTPEELELFNQLLPKYLRWCAAHRYTSFHQKEPRQEQITDREGQAMYNFAHEGIPFETIAEHFARSIAEVVEQVVHRPWLRSSKQVRSPNLTWWESDHSDPLELAKLYYPQYLPKKTAPHMSAREKRQPPTLDAEAYLEAEYGREYVTEKNVQAVNDLLAEIADHLGKTEPDYDADFLKKMLDAMLS